MFKRINLMFFVLWLVITLSIQPGVLLAAGNMENFCKTREGTLYANNFDSGNLTGWQLDRGWALAKENNQNVLTGSGHVWAIFSPSDMWSDYTLDLDFKQSGETHYCFRFNDMQNRSQRYFLNLRQDGYGLIKNIGKDFSILVDGPLAVPPASWHHLTIAVQGNAIKISIDQQLVVDYTDRESPISAGGIGFEPVDNSSLTIDNLKVTGTFVSQKNLWKKTGGPLGGLGYDVRISPANKNIMFVTDIPSGVNKSINGGTSWFQSNTGVTTRTGTSNDDIPIFSLTIDPNNPNIIWTGTQSARGVFKSVDGGKTWAKMDNGIAEQNEITFRGFAIKPGDSNVVLAGTEIDKNLFGQQFARQKGKIYKTTDGGKNWICVWEGGSLARIIIFDPQNPDILYASTGIFDREAYNMTGEGVLKSTDGGNTWHNINQGLENLFVGFLEMHPQDPNTLICAAGNYTYNNGGGIYITHNGGQTWKKVITPLIASEPFSVATYSQSNPDIVYAGNSLYFSRSENGGATWRMCTKQPPYGPPGVRAGIPVSAVVDPNNPMVVFVNNYGGGVFKSIDGACTWIETSTGYTGANVHQVVVSPAGANTVYAIGRSGPFISINGGQKWTGLYYRDINRGEWNDIAICPSNSQVILCSDECTGIMYRSTDGGRTWKTVFAKYPEGKNPATAHHGFKALEFAPSNNRVVYAGMRKERNAIDGNTYKGPSFGMYKSTDAGLTWQEINRGLETADKNINCIAVQPNNENIVYIGTYRDGVYKSTDGGKTWHAASNGLMSEDVRSLAIAPNDPNSIYAGLGNGVGLYKSSDAGGSWSAAGTGISTECPSYLQRIGQVNPGVSLEKPVRTVGVDYVSTPWTLISSVVIMPSNPRVLFISDYHRGVYLSVDNGASWTPINDGLDYKAVTSLALAKNESVLYASTSGGGVYRMELK